MRSVTRMELCLNATISLTCTLENECSSSNEISNKNGTVRWDCIACDALLEELRKMSTLQAQCIANRID